MNKKIRAEPSKKESYYNSRNAKKEICKLRNLFNKSCRGCIYKEECEKGDRQYEDHKIKSRRD